MLEPPPRPPQKIQDVEEEEDAREKESDAQGRGGKPSGHAHGHERALLLCGEGDGADLPARLVVGEDADDGGVVVGGGGAGDGLALEVVAEGVGGVGGVVVVRVGAAQGGRHGPLKITKKFNINM